MRRVLLIAFLLAGTMLSAREHGPRPESLAAGTSQGLQESMLATGPQEDMLATSPQEDTLVIGQPESTLSTEMPGSEIAPDAPRRAFFLDGLTQKSARSRAYSTYRNGKIFAYTGAAFTALGGVMLYLLDQGAFSRLNAVSGTLLVVGTTSALTTGICYVIAGVPMAIAGKAMLDHDPWRTVSFSGEGQRGPGILLEGTLMLPTTFQVRAAAGYHFNEHLFLGGGFAPGVQEGYETLTMPIYIDFRWSIGKRLLAPYLGCAAGFDIFDVSPYLAAEAGLRVRNATDRPTSLWTSFMGEVGGGYGRIGFKMGWSF